MAHNPRHLLEGKIRKLQQLYELMGDPEVEAEVSQLFSHRNGVVSEAVKPASTATKAHHVKKGRGGRKHNMVRSALEVVNGSDKPITARMVADQLTQQGFRFSPGNKYVAVSKALRWLWKHKEITARKTAPSPKAPMIYSRLHGVTTDAVGSEGSSGNAMHIRPSAHKILTFLREKGPARWTDMANGIDIGNATLYSTLRKYPHLFRRNPDGRWEVAQKHESQPA